MYAYISVLIVPDVDINEATMTVLHLQLHMALRHDKVSWFDGAAGAPAILLDRDINVFSGLGRYFPIRGKLG